MGGKQLGLLGLGVMGKSLALNFLEKGIHLSVYNRQVPGLEVDLAQHFVIENPEATGFDDMQAFVASLEVPRKVFLMVNAGKAVDSVIEQLLPYLQAGDIVMDGGNSHFIDTQRRTLVLQEKGIYFMGIGVSGGEEGARRGPAIMAGGNTEAYDQVSTLLDLIAARDKLGKPCSAYMGPEGAGHFVKMVHNGIEYAEMQILAEIYSLSKELMGYEEEDIARLLSHWQIEGEGSFLLEITQYILRKKEDGELLLDKIVDAAEQKGTGGWSLKAALDMGIPLDTISAAVSARMASALRDERVHRHSFYPTLGKSIDVIPPTEEELKGAYIAARIVNHVVGFGLLRQASIQYNWNLHLGEIARVWTNGCIIRSELIEKLSKCLDEEKDLLVHPNIVETLSSTWWPLSHVVSKGFQKGLALPVLSASLNYFLSSTKARSSANLIQAQRDYFGAHTYRRIDRPEDHYFHTHWTS